LTRLPDGPAAPGTGCPVLGDGPELECALTPAAPKVVVVVLGATRRGLKPLASQPEALGERVELLEGVGLEMPATGPASPIAGGKRVVDIDTHLPGVEWGQRLGHGRAVEIGPERAQERNARGGGR
jgi:hypothetical protein